MKISWEISWKGKVAKYLFIIDIAWCLLYRLNTTAYQQENRLPATWADLVLVSFFFFFLCWEYLPHYRGGKTGALVWGGTFLYILDFAAIKLLDLLNALNILEQRIVSPVMIPFWLLIPFLAGLGLTLWGIHRAEKVRRCAQAESQKDKED